MLKLCLIRGCRIILMLVIFTLLSLVLFFLVAPNANEFEQYIETKLQTTLHAEQVDISQVQLAWHAGPVLDIGRVDIVAPSFVVEQASIQVSYSLFDMLLGSLAPEIIIQDGKLGFDLDVKSEHAFKPLNVKFTLKNMQLTLLYQQQKQVLYDANVYIKPLAQDVLVQAKGLMVHVVLNDDYLPKLVRLNIEDFSGFPASWMVYVQGLSAVHFNLQQQDKLAWQWDVNIQGDHSLVAVDEIHLRVPFEHFIAQGDVALEQGESFALQTFNANTLNWKGKDDFANTTLSWKDDILHLEVLDATASMPKLWSWLWMLGGNDWHTWLSQMHHGRVKNVRGTLDLPWSKPLVLGLAQARFSDMTYHVTTQVSEADIALGLADDYLYQVVADVELDDKQLHASIQQADLNGGIGLVSGDYKIIWKTLLMEINAQGVADVGKLHTWLEPESAQVLHWGEAPAKAEVRMLWYANKAEPEKTIVQFYPDDKVWALKPNGIALKVESGMAVWDYNRGLDLSNMQVSTPWFEGELSMFLDKQQAWALDNLSLTGVAPLANLTRDFSLPIIQPQGDTTFELGYADKQWQATFDFQKNTWKSFAGFAKPKQDELALNLAGKPTSTALLPIYFHQMQVKQDGFDIDGNLTIEHDKLDFNFEHIKTVLVEGQMRLLMPLDSRLPWGIESNTSFLNQKLIHPYITSEQPVSDGQPSRPWQVFASTKSLLWNKSTIKDVQIQFNSDTQSTGLFTAASADIGASHLQNIETSFTMLEHGKVDLHYLQADGSDQHVMVSGSVKPNLDGVFVWQGLALMSGKFGTLMQQAELDQLFKEGDMQSLFLGSGEFKQGEPWWRGMKGSLRLRVDDGRILEGGTLTHLLAAISLVDLPKYLIFQRGDVVGEGLFYNKLQIEAEFNAEILDIKQLALKSSALDAGGTGKVNLDTGDLDILLIARPWQNIEAIIGSIPLFGYLLAGEDKSFLRKVYRIHGPASDAAVDELNPEDAGLPQSGLLETLFSLPSRWFGE
ncbi:MAG: AsmA-like C-terminal domain-containing protein [Ghiorsea sp.]|nr:AsmA-like C-terminal domain-containing protein [Ghiorsea sp.]